MERLLASNAPSARLAELPTRADESTAGEAKGVSTRGLLAAETYLFRIGGREQRLSIDATAPSQVARSGTLGRLGAPASEPCLRRCDYEPRRQPPEDLSDRLQGESLLGGLLCRATNASAYSDANGRDEPVR